MRMQKGICMELDGDRSVYMLADGRFVAGRPTEGTSVGEEAYFEILGTASGKRRFKPFAMPLIASVAALFLLISTWMLPAQEAYGYVQVESNPGIELGIDDEWHVISLRELNEDGKQLIARLADWENRELETVLENVLALSVDEDTEHVTITTVQEEDETDAIAKVEKIALAALFAGSNRQLHVHMKEANKKQWRKAKEQQVPLAKLIEKDRTFTAPPGQRNDAQPAQNSRTQEKQVPKGHTVPSKAETPAVPENQPKRDEGASRGESKSDKAQKAETKANPAAGNKNGEILKDPAPQTPAGHKGAKKAEKPEPAKPKNPNAGKGNHSGKAKAESKPKKENPSSGKNKSGQPKNNKGNSGGKETGEGKSKNGNGNDKGKEKGETRPAKTDGAKTAEPNGLKPGQSKPSAKEHGSSAASKAEKENKPQSEKQGKDRQ
ncbi:anti-sigma-I factor RsgI family protein [Planococcus plakortidis]|uniref:anti-sigma-I factor RsgI family protein n=1 Tax=Planococcus plakortidis TaxID=1038856 RepID=UPI00385C93A4